MSRAGKILSVSPQYAIPGGEVIIECENFEIDLESGYGVFFDGQGGRIVSASSSRVVAIIPDIFDTNDVDIYLESHGERSESVTITVGKLLAEGLHIVANPAVDPKDDSIILTRSGSRGQQLPVTIFRLEADGYLQEMSADVMNPTGVAFDRLGEICVSNRMTGDVFRVTRTEEVIPIASDLGIATGIAFDKEGTLYVGDRTGKISRITGLGIPEEFAALEPSVSAYHLAFDEAGNLCVAAPGLSSYDSVYTIDKNGNIKDFYRGLGRPQGMAFDTEGNLYIAACLRARRGIVRIDGFTNEAKLMVAGMNIVGVCFNRKGDMIIATNDSVYSLPLGIKGLLLN